MRLLLLFWLVLLSFFQGKETDCPKKSENLTLKWNKAYADDSIDKAAIGLEWALSYCGARLPNAPYAIQVNTDKIMIDVNELGFDENALAQLHLLHQKIRASEAYKVNKNIDLGHYIALLIGASEHYYRITGVPNRLSELLLKYELTPEIGYVNHSGVSKTHRKIQFSDPKNFNQLLIASEIDSVTGNVKEFEVIDLMPNGQPRFAIYDAAGNRKNSAYVAHSEAGKPAKCLWCHESKISQMFNTQDDFPGFLTYRQLQDKLVTFNQMLDEYKKTLQGGVDFAQKQQHTQAELLYISYMEPSAERLALEWNLSVDRIKNLLESMPTHLYDEFPFLGPLYDRHQIERFAPFKGLQVSTHVREFSEIEVNHLTK